MRTLRTLLVSVAMTFCMASAQAASLSATCGPLTGIKLSSIEGKSVSEASSQVGPVFFIDASSPQKLISVWKVSALGVESSDKYEATVVEFSAERVQAVE